MVVLIEAVQAGPDFDISVKLSIASTAELLGYAANSAFEIVDGEHNRCPAVWLSLFSKDYWQERGCKVGWCPSQVQIAIRSSFSIQSIYYFISVDSDSSIERHQNCGRQKCAAGQTNLERYGKKHDSNDCQCGDLIVNPMTLDKILTNGKLPLLRIHEGQIVDQLTCDIVASSPDSRYVAISHVWAHGLGNPNANTLPKCQVRRLNTLVGKLNPLTDINEHPTAPFVWCDTLCCPTKPDEAKYRALTQMRKTYADASMVLVVDASLQTHDTNLMTVEEICTRIVSSDWMRRLWTLQEGALPSKNRRLYFQFQDRAINIHDLWSNLLHIYDVQIGRRGLASSLIHQIRGFTAPFDTSQIDPGADIANVEIALKSRSVTVSTDEPHLIGTLLDLDVAHIIDGTEETRIFRMWSCMPTAKNGIPKGILFRPGPRLEREGFRWAPSTFLGNADTDLALHTVRTGNNQGTPSPLGLHVRLPGFNVTFPERPFGNIYRDKNQFYMRDNEGVWYLIKRYSSASNSDRFLGHDLSNVVQTSDRFWVTYLETTWINQIEGLLQTMIGLLVQVTQEESTITYGRSCLHLHMSKMQSPTREMFEAGYQCAQSFAARQLTSKTPGSEQNIGSSQDEAVLNALDPDINEIAGRDYPAALATARQITQHSEALFGAVVKRFLAGCYAVMGPKVSENQEWCID